MKIRQAPSIDSTAVDQLNIGEKAVSGCNVIPGGAYAACGGKSKAWIFVVHENVKRYVAALCVTLHKSG